MDTEISGHPRNCSERVGLARKSTRTAIRIRKRRSSKTRLAGRGFTARRLSKGFSLLLSPSRDSLEFIFNAPDLSPCLGRLIAFSLFAFVYGNLPGPTGHYGAPEVR